MPAKFTKKITTTYSMTSVAELTRAEIIGLLLFDITALKFNNNYTNNQVFQDIVDVELLSMALLENNWTTEIHLDDAKGHWVELYVGNPIENSSLKGYFTIRICPIGEEGLRIQYWTWDKEWGLRQFISNWDIKECMKLLTNELV